MTTLRLMIVEGDRQIAEIQRRFLERLDDLELVGIAHTLADAREQIGILAPDLILLDVYFPEGNSLDLLRELRATNSASDVILITAAKEVETLRTALRGGVYERLAEALERYRQHLNALAGIDRVAQREVDALLPRGQPEPALEASSRLPKGIDALTLDKIRSVMQSAGDWSAEAVGAEIGASRTTARRYLEHLVSAGEFTAEVSYGNVGRPERRYRRLE